VAKQNPELWKQGITLLKQTSLWGEIAESEYYGKKWKKANLSELEIENLIASEVHSRLVGKNSKQVIDSLTKQDGS